MSALGNVTGTVRSRHPASLALIALPLLAALIGAVLALAFGKPAAEKPHAAAPVAASAGAVVSAGPLRVTLPEGWTPTRTGPKIPGFDRAHATFVRSYDSDVAIALLPARSPSLLPPALDVATNPASARPRIQRAGAVSAYDYVRPGKDQRVLDIVVVPTTLGVATIACSSAVVAPDECAQALHGLRVRGGSFLPLSTESAFLAALPDAMKNLGAQRLRLRTRLTRAGLVGGAARTAYRLAGTYGTADRALRPLAAPHSDARSTVILLRRLRSRYFTLAAAIRTRDRAAFKATARSIETNEQRLAARVEAWQRALAR
ncbi:MAG TPA: hypothetical protein VF080_18570 [Solirubrobacteraceae bacterium]